VAQLPGINDEEGFLVFVGFAERSEMGMERPESFILGQLDWVVLMRRAMREYKEKHPERQVKLVGSCLVFIDEVNSQGQHHRGCGVKPSQIQDQWERYDKIVERVLM